MLHACLYSRAAHLGANNPTSQQDAGSSSGLVLLLLQGQALWFETETVALSLPVLMDHGPSARYPGMMQTFLA